MSELQHTIAAACPISSLSFGLNRNSDERFLAVFLQRFTDDRLLDLLIPRMDDATLIMIVDFITRLMKDHLTDTEYHQVFLGGDVV